MKIRNVLGSTLLALLLQTTLWGVDIIAHRGASYTAPENTLSAVKLGWEEGSDGVEFDLWLSKDGKVVVFHDADTRRFENPPRKISETTLSELQALDVGGWKAAKYKGETIPSLESILATVPKGKQAVLEIKCGPEIVPELVRVTGKSGRSPDELVFISFNFASMAALKQAFPRSKQYYLYSYKKDEKTGKFPEVEPLIAQAKGAKLDGLNLQSTWPITAGFAKKVHDSGLKLLVWTVDDPAAAKSLKAAGVDAITTNRPKFIREALEGK